MSNIARSERQLVTRINIAVIARAVLLAMTTQCAPAAEPAPVLEERFRIAQGGRNNISIKVDEVRVVRETITRGRLSG